MNRSNFDRLKRLHPAYIFDTDIELSVGEALDLIESRMAQDAPRRSLTLYDVLCDAFRKVNGEPNDEALGVFEALCRDKAALPDSANESRADFCETWSRVLMAAAGRVVAERLDGPPRRI